MIRIELDGTKQDVSQEEVFNLTALGILRSDALVEVGGVQRKVGELFDPSVPERHSACVLAANREFGTFLSGENPEHAAQAPPVPPSTPMFPFPSRPFYTQAGLKFPKQNTEALQRRASARGRSLQSIPTTVYQAPRPFPYFGIVTLAFSLFAFFGLVFLVLAIAYLVDAFPELENEDSPLSIFIGLGMIGCIGISFITCIMGFVGACFSGYDRLLSILSIVFSVLCFSCFFALIIIGHSVR